MSFNILANTRKVSYRKLQSEVNLLARALIDAGIRKGDVVAIYLPMIPEALFSIFACSKIGAVHTTRPELFRDFYREEEPRLS